MYKHGPNAKFRGYPRNSTLSDHRYTITACQDTNKICYCGITNLRYLNIR